MSGGPAFRIAVLVSGRGSNLRALVDAIQSGVLHAAVVGVFSDRPQCPAMRWARDNALPTTALRAADFPSREAFDAALFDQIHAAQPDLVVCAGYMRLISAAAVSRFVDRMINIHPSLLPRHPGLDTHGRALAAGEAEHGASVHGVIAAVDAGAVLAQAHVPVLPGDSAESLGLRVLSREHPLLVQSVIAISEGKLALRNGQAWWRGTFLSSPLSLNSMDELEETR